MVKSKKAGTHLTIHNNVMSWNWDVLVHEVKAAILAYESKQETKAAKKPAVKKTKTKKEV